MVNRERLKEAIRRAVEQTKHPWLGFEGGIRQRKLVSITLDDLNTLLKAAKRELQRT